MIFVTLGTSKQDFSRLIKEIDRLIEKKVINEEIIVQSNKCMYSPVNFKVIDELSNQEYKDYMKKADIIITHGGVGSIMDALNYHKKIIGIPRLSKYKEVVNDHQKQILDEFSKMGYLLTGDVLELEKLLDEVKSFGPKIFSSNNLNFNKLLLDEINN